MEASMIDLRRIVLAAMLLANMTPGAYAANETATRPWSAPTGHRQPHAADIPTGISASQQIIDQEDANVDRKIRGICRGC
jgi:hypothetical protein